jgi:membrane protein DedA with SNARE-associated domain
VDLWVSFWSDLTSLIAAHGLLTVAALVMLKSAGVPVPVPGDLLIVIVGADVRDAGDALWPAWLLLSAATALGAGLLYELARWIGADELIHYGHYIGLTPARLEQAEGRLHSRGQRAIFVARIVPGLRLAIIVVCGMLRISRTTVAPAVCLGALVYVGICLLLGYAFGPLLVPIVAQLVFPAGLLVPLAVATLVLVWLVRARRHPRTDSFALTRGGRVRAGALAGALSVAGSSAIENVVIYIGGPLAAALLSVPDSHTPEGLLYLFDASINAVILGVAWGSIYAAGEAHRPLDWPDWLHGLVFATLPLLGAVLLLGTLTIAVGAEPQQTWLVAATAESIRWALYGIFLGLSYPVFRARRAASRTGGALPAVR